MNIVLPVLSSISSIVPQSMKKSRLGTRLRHFILQHVIAHDAIYTADYYATNAEPIATRSVEAMSESIADEFQARTVIDVGCGTGALLEALQSRGCQGYGLEYSEAALVFCRERGLDVQKFNLERDILTDDRTFDVAVSMEVAEHLPQRIADRYVRLLTRLSNTIVFTAARSGQGGRDHVNEQPPSYWISKFRASGFAHDEELSMRWRQTWRDSAVIASCYYQNLMIFRRT